MASKSPAFIGWTLSAGMVAKRLSPLLLRGLSEGGTPGSPEPGMLAARSSVVFVARPMTRGLHSFTFQLNV